MSNFYPHLSPHCNTSTPSRPALASGLFGLFFFLPGMYTSLIFIWLANFTLQASPQTLWDAASLYNNAPSPFRVFNIFWYCFIFSVDFCFFFLYKISCLSSMPSPVSLVLRSMPDIYWIHIKLTEWMKKHTSFWLLIYFNYIISIVFISVLNPTFYIHLTEATHHSQYFFNLKFSPWN